jgi:hypothetical protein
MKRFTIFLMTIALIGVNPAYGAIENRSFKNCAELNKIYEGGVAKNKKVTNRNSKGVPQESKYRPTVNKKIYNVNMKRLDRDKDGIACER